jgi:hypothetical protein
MSNVSPWLRGQRKTELVELATAAGLTEYVRSSASSSLCARTRPEN